MSPPGARRGSAPRAGVLIVAGLALAFAGPAASEVYVGGGVGVAQPFPGFPPLFDDGAVVCTETGPDFGGACIPFGDADRGTNAVGVVDTQFWRSVAFQVCIDNDQDGACGTPPSLACGDDLFFSHDDQGNFHNPIGPLPTNLRPGCPANPDAAHQGYIVLLCQGVHGDGPLGAPAHAHPTTQGKVALDTPPVGGNQDEGTFCGAGERAVKPYTVVDNPAS